MAARGRVGPVQVLCLIVVVVLALLRAKQIARCQAAGSTRRLTLIGERGRWGARAGARSLSAIIFLASSACARTAPQVRLGRLNWPSAPIERPAEPAEPRHGLHQRAAASHLAHLGPGWCFGATDARRSALSHANSNKRARARTFA